MIVGLKNFTDVGFPLDESQTKVFQRRLKVSQMHLQGCRATRRRHGRSIRLICLKVVPYIKISRQI